MKTKRLYSWFLILVFLASLFQTPVYAESFQPDAQVQIFESQETDIVDSVAAEETIGTSDQLSAENQDEAVVQTDEELPVDNQDEAAVQTEEETDTDTEDLTEGEPAQEPVQLPQEGSVDEEEQLPEKPQTQEEALDGETVPPVDSEQPEEEVPAYDLFSLSDEELTLEVGESRQLTLYDNYNNPVPYDTAELTWESSDSEVVEVDAEGNVTAKGVGAAYVTAIIASYSWTCQVTVEGPDYDCFELSDDELHLGFPEGAQLTLYDDHHTQVASDTPGLSWKSSDTKVATVDKKGYVTAKSDGSVVITASLNGFSWTCSVSVKVPDCHLSKTSLSLGTGYSKKLYLYDDSENPLSGVTWKTSNKAIATVNSKGTVKGIKAGSATISATFGGRVLKCKITVKAPTLSATKKTLGFGKTLQLKLKNYKGTVTWASSNKNIATVSKTGKVTAKKKAGKVTITAKADGKKYKCTITVKDTTWDKVTKTYKTISLKKGNVWFVDRRSTANKKGTTIVHPFKMTYSDTVIFSLFPEAKTKFAIFNAKGKQVWTKTASKETHVKVKLSKGSYTFKALTSNSNNQHNGYSLRATGASNSFLPIELGHFSMNSAYGIEPEFLILNTKGKTINFINFNATFYNAANNRLYSTVGGYSYSSLRIIGPIDPWECGWFSFEPIFYNKDVAKMKVSTAKITYMDGSTETIAVNKTYSRFE